MTSSDLGPTALPIPNEPEPSDMSTLAAGASISLVGRFSGAVAVAVLQILLARSLGAQAFGLYALGWTLLNLLGIVATLGLHFGVIRFGSAHWRRSQPALKGVLVAGVGISVLSGGTAGAGVYLASPWLSSAIFHEPKLTPLLVLFAFAYPLFTGLKVTAAATRITQKTQYSILAEGVVQPFLALLLVGVLLWLGLGVVGAVLGSVISFAGALLLAIFFLWRLFPSAFAGPMSFETTPRRLMTFSSVSVLAAIFGLMINRTDRLFVGYFLSASDVGVYQAAAQASVVFALVLGSFNAIFAPMIADLYHRGEMQRLQRVFRTSTRWGVTVCLPIFLVLVMLSKDIMGVVFGQAYVRGAGVLMVLSLAQMINLATGGVGFVLIMTGREARWMAISGIGALLNVGLNLLLVPRLGAVGAALTTAVSISFIFGWGLIVARRLVGIWPYDWSYWKGLAAALVAAGGIILVRGLPAVSPLARLISALVVAGLSFSGSLMLFGLEDEDRELLGVVRAQLGRRIRPAEANWTRRQ